MRILPFILLPCLVLPAFTLASASACDEARDQLRTELAAQGLTRRAAELTRIALDACPGVAPDGSEPVVAAQPGADFKAAATPVLARDCGFTDVVTAHDEHADVTAWETVLLQYTFPTYEHGPADVAYHPALDLTVYRGHGEIYGVTAQSNWVGTVTIHGVEIPANGGANASSGCTTANPELCWGSGMATVTVPAVYTVSVIGRMDVC